MARKPKPSGQLNKGPWPISHIRAVLHADGWVQHSQRGSHENLKHPTRSGKITLDNSWTGGVAAKDAVFGFMASQGGYSKKEFIRLMNRV